MTRVEHPDPRKMRAHNKKLYRLAHWPIWIWVFFLLPGPLVFNLFDHGGDWRNWLWLVCVMLATGLAGLKGKLPGVEPRPYILCALQKTVPTLCTGASVTPLPGLHC
jgi:hypothetical protein